MRLSLRPESRFFVVMDEKDAVLVAIDGAVATVTLNRPKRHNAFNPAMVDMLTKTFLSIGLQEHIRVVILTGSGHSFCAGADLASMREAAGYSFEENLADGEAIFDLMVSVDRCPCPVVGRINGSAFGGGIGLVSCCDIVVAVDRAQFGFSEVHLGLAPAVISPFVLVKIGQTNGRELMLTGERFAANHAQSIGLVHHVVGEDQLDEKVGERVLELLKSAPEAVARAKVLIRDIAGKTIESKRQYTTNLIAELRSSPEGLEGLNAFLEKRDPLWRD